MARQGTGGGLRKRKIMNCNSFTYTDHAVNRLFNRSIEIEDVEIVVSSGTIIENYPTDKPYPSCLILGFVGLRPIHVVIGKNPNGACVVITAYEPNLMKWEVNFITKKIN